jgi:hypothetical protein
MIFLDHGLILAVNLNTVRLRHPGYINAIFLAGLWGYPKVLYCLHYVAGTVLHFVQISSCDVLSRVPLSTKYFTSE